MDEAIKVVENKIMESGNTPAHYYYNRYMDKSSIVGMNKKTNADCSIKNDSATSDNQCKAGSKNSDNGRPVIGNPNVSNKHDKRVVNLSSMTLTFEEINILSKGLGFAVAPKNIPFESIICNIEYGTQGLSSNNKEILRQECSLAMLKSKRPKSNLNKEG